MNKANEEERKTLGKERRDEKAYEEERIRMEKAEKERDSERLLKKNTNDKAAEKESLLELKAEEDAEKARIEKEKKDEEKRLQRRKELAVAKIKKEEEKLKLTANNGLNSKPINSGNKRDEVVEMKEKGKELNKKTVALKRKNESDTSDDPPKKIKVENAPKKMAFTFDEEGLPIWEEKEFPRDRIPPRPHGWDQHLWDTKCLKTLLK